MGRDVVHGAHLGVMCLAMVQFTAACSCELTGIVRFSGDDAAPDGQNTSGAPNGTGGRAAGGGSDAGTGGGPDASGGTPGTGGMPGVRDSGGDAFPDAEGDAGVTDAGDAGDADDAGESSVTEAAAPLPSCALPGRARRGGPGSEAGSGARGRVTLPGEVDHSGTWVTLIPGGHRAVTGSDGAFCFTGVAGGSYRMVLENGAFSGEVPAVAVSSTTLMVTTSAGPVPLPELSLARGTVLTSACTFGFGGGLSVHLAPGGSGVLASCSVTGLPKSLVPRPTVSMIRPALEFVSLVDGERILLATGEDPAEVFPYPFFTDWGRGRTLYADSDHAGMVDLSGQNGAILASPRPPELVAGAPLGLSADGAWLVRFGAPLLSFPLGGGPAVTLASSVSQVRFATGGMELLYVTATGELVRQGVDGSARSVLVTVPDNPGLTTLRLAPDGGRVAYAEGTSSTTCSLMTTDRGAVPVALGPCLEAPLFNGNAHVLWADEPGAGGDVTTLFVAEAANPSAAPLVTAATGESLSLVAAVGSGHVLFTRASASGPTSLELVSLQGGTPIVLDAGVDATTPRYSVSPSQQQILLMPTAHELVLYDIGTGEFRTVSNQAESDTLASWPWSPSGQYVLFRECSSPSACGTGSDVPVSLLARTDGSTPPQAFAALPARPLVMDFSPDERKILVQEAGRLFWIDVPTRVPTEIVTHFEGQSGPALWLDSNRILFTDVANLPGIYVADACAESDAGVP